MARSTRSSKRLQNQNEMKMMNIKSPNEETSEKLKGKYFVLEFQQL